MYCSIPAIEGITAERFRTAGAVTGAGANTQLAGYVGRFGFTTFTGDPYSQPKFMWLIFVDQSNTTTNGCHPNLCIEVSLKYYVEVFGRKNLTLGANTTGNEFPGYTDMPGGGTGPNWSTVPGAPPLLPNVQPDFS